MASLIHNISPTLQQSHIRACIMDSEMPYFSFSHYHQAPGASCSILYILVLSLVIFIQSLYTLSNLKNVSFTCLLSLTLARACAAKGYCSRLVGRFVCPRFLSNRGCCRYQTWICGYVQRALGTARVWNVVVKEKRVYGGRLKFSLMCTFLVKAESGGCQTWICG